MPDCNEPRKASEWLVRLLEAPADDKLRAQFARWMASDPRHRRDWREVLTTYEALGGLAPTKGDAADSLLAPAQAAAEDAVARAARSARRSRLLAAGAGALAACLVVVYAPEIALRLEADAVTAAAETRRIALEDGGEAWLSPETAIAIDYAAETRRIRLLKGAAFFKVAKDRSRPFTVAAGDVSATALGTAFEVRRHGDASRVAVEHGLVAVEGDAPGDAAEPIGAGEWVRASAAGVEARGATPAEQVAAWRQGRLIVKDRGVGEVVDAIRPYYRGVIVLIGDRLAQEPVTGVFDLDHPVAALSAMARAQRAHARQISPWLVVITAD